MTSDDYVRSKLLSFAWRAASHVSKNAIVCVMFVVRTRVGEERNWIGVLNKLEKDAPLPNSDVEDIRDPQFTSLLEYVDGIVDGTKQDRWTMGAEYWFDGKLDHKWFDLLSKQRVGNLEGLVFYK